MRIEDFSLKNVSSSPGVYLMKDSQGVVLYVGKAKNLRNRLSSYLQKNGDSRERIPFLMKRTADIDTIVVSNETEALLLENNLIKKYQPRYNVLLKDDKTFFCLSISLQHPWPKIEAIRTRALSPSKKKQLLFGPYVSAEACYALLEVISHWFPLRTCSDREFSTRQRPCVLYEMKRCLAPCVGFCSQTEYQETLEKAILFLKGEVDTTIANLEEAIKKASQEHKFEHAAALYRTLTLIRQTMAKQHVEKFQAYDIDVLGLYRKGPLAIISVLSVYSGKLLGARHFTFPENAQEDSSLFSSFILQYYAENTRIPKQIFVPVSPDSPELPYLLNAAEPPKIRCPKTEYGKELLALAHKNAAEQAKPLNSITLPYEELQQLFKFSQYPNRIECYDNAHLQGEHNVGVYIVFEKGSFSPKQYRTFSITSHGDDLAAFEEVLTRRFRSLTTELPDLIVIDGGRNQFRRAQHILEKLNLTGIAVVSIAKESGNHSRGLQQEKLFCEAFPQGILLNPTSEILQFFQLLRDEAHRFAINRYRNKHSKAILTTKKIPGIGKTKTTHLLQKFKSWKRILSASEEELKTVQGLTKKDIQRIQEEGKRAE
ncbi:UvrABC system protein C [Chlamydia muridarum str. Nigg]|uniref:UvrABC system protein C n=2 Tax=Chlamydia muridarum TaxID=83560 RepID=UVRC_CHLMU|nr:excinuclease ABC subunit UvrC [Chlamydia muridarum]Q9PLD1.2 RecName: Full=UvrABC system protein C; Short=Protein UvrC; AltName: Full=Excinuclease ABC subunit C [Chlamydia muridarum str. Nigg]UFX34459.1 excinuclease ABC subunit UvrC [Chlamydia trachomatis]AHH22566.1 excinuclease ABC subunit C [Chlamydia muridarum str. Nigg3 CMUT3-5]AHH23490.1 excinuclease ABC subunit C [Chlamydia muridarum str. Nigg CM972]AID37713.1 excinuclease ABC subunit C [Chlamydia muridarum str. Nigg 2 MCR]AIT91075.1 